MVCTFCHTVQAPTDVTHEIDRIRRLDAQLGVHCPVCDAEFTAALIDDVPACYCPGCHGLLIKNSEFRRVVESRRAAYCGPEMPAALPHPIELQRRIPCPLCHQTMEVHPYYGAGRAIIDSCTTCQLIWIDMGELTNLERTPGRRSPAAYDLVNLVDRPALTVTTQTQTARSDQEVTDVAGRLDVLGILSQLLD